MIHTTMKIRTCINAMQAHDDAHKLPAGTLDSRRLRVIWLRRSGALLRCIPKAYWRPPLACLCGTQCVATQKSNAAPKRGLLAELMCCTWVQFIYFETCTQSCMLTHLCTQLGLQVRQQQLLLAPEVAQGLSVQHRPRLAERDACRRGCPTRCAAGRAWASAQAVVCQRRAFYP